MIDYTVNNSTNELTMNTAGDDAINEFRHRSIGTSTFTVKDIAYLGVMVALMEIAKIALAVIPNVELVSMLLIIFTIMMGRKAYLVTAGYAIVECLLWGMGTWVVMYLYIWPVLVTAVLILQKLKIESVWAYAITSGVFGLLFGAMGALTYVAIGGWSMGFSWWVAGIPYDLIHGVSNFVICMALYKPLLKIVTRLQ